MLPLRILRPGGDSTPFAFCKAAKWAEFLEKQCGVHGDQRSQREAEAYTAFMKGTLLLEQENWKEALEKLLRCKKVCEQLALASDPAEAKLLKDHVLELAPSIRQCQYRSGQTAEDGDEDASPNASAGGLEGLQYRGHGLASPSEKIKEKLLKCLQLAKDIGASGDEKNSTALIEKYGEVAAEFSDLLKDIHTDMISGGKDGDGPTLTEDEWQLIEAFAREMSVCLNIERNVALLCHHLAKLETIVDISSQEARKSCRPEEGMRFCDLLKEDLQNLRDLPKTSSSISETLSSYEEIARNCRCLFLALCQIILNKPLESAALLDNLHARADVELGESLEEPLSRLHPQFEKIAENFPKRVSQWRCRVLAQLCSKAKGNTQEQARQVTEAPFPPRVQDIPCKPLLFDLAFPCLVEPDFDELLPKAAEKKGPGMLNKAAGVASRIGGWFRSKQ
jgi:signal recognition particle subunit SRP68